jgi:hypothetical protein
MASGARSICSSATAATARRLALRCRLPPAVSRACHNRALQSAMLCLGNEPTPLRDAYPGGPDRNVVTLDIARRQLHAMRARDLERLDAVLDERIRQLGYAFA